MKKLIIFLLVLGLFIQNFDVFYSDAIADTTKKTINDTASYSLLLKTNTSCASGFITNDNKIITAAHVVKGCVKNDCSNIDVYYEGNRLILGNLKIFKISYALDVAVLTFDEISSSNDNKIKNAIDISNPKEVYNNEEIKILGSPRCESYKETKGHVTQNNNLLLSSDAKVYFGSSGSLVVNSENQFVGMAIKAKDIQSSIKSLILGSSLNASIIKGIHIKNLINTIDEEILPYEINVLNKYYKENIINNFTPIRYPNTFNFMIMTNNIFLNLPLYKTSKESYIKDILQSSYNAPFILSNISYDRSLTKEEEEAEKLVLFYSFEKKGFSNSEFKILDSISLIESLNIKERTKEHKEELNYIIKNAKRNSKNSYMMSLIATSIWVICLIAILVFFWIFTSGYYFSKFQGSKKARVLKLILFLFTWPISLIYNKVFKNKK